MCPRSVERGARRSEEEQRSKGAKEGVNTRTKITSDEVCSKGCCGLTGLPMY